VQIILKMALKITNKNENPVFSRDEITAEIEFTGPIPSRKEVKQQLAKQLSVEGSLIVITKIEPKYGKGNALVTVNVYKDKKIMDEIEPKYYLDRDAGIKGGKKADKKEEKKPETKPEEKKEAEPAKEQKKEEAKPKPKKEEKPAEEKKEETRKEQSSFVSQKPKVSVTAEEKKD